MSRRKAYICAPMAGDTENNIARAKTYVLLAIKLGLLPICTHLMGDLFDDGDPEQRRVALSVGIEWVKTLDPVRDELWCCGPEVTHGMTAEIDLAKALGVRIIIKTDADLKAAGIRPHRAKAVPYQQVIEAYNACCPSLPKLVKLSEARKKAIRAGFAKGYELDDYIRLFEAAESSAFLKGETDRGKPVNFDWLIKENNMVKTLEGRYSEKWAAKAPKESKTGHGGFGFEALEQKIAAKMGVVT